MSNRFYIAGVLSVPELPALDAVFGPALLDPRVLDDAVSRLERCASTSLQWSRSNAVRFEASKTGRPYFLTIGDIEIASEEFGWEM